MTTAIIVLHILACIFLILVVLLQTGKGSEMGAAFGGATQTVFGSGGAIGFLGKLTTIIAVIFMITSLTLGYLSVYRTEVSVMKETPQSTKNSHQQDPNLPIKGEVEKSPDKTIPPPVNKTDGQ